jgi:hypothetical protein
MRKGGQFAHEEFGVIGQLQSRSAAMPRPPLKLKEKYSIFLHLNHRS